MKNDSLINGDQSNEIKQTSLSLTDVSGLSSFGLNKKTKQTIHLRVHLIGYREITSSQSGVVLRSFSPNRIITGSHSCCVRRRPFLPNLLSLLSTNYYLLSILPFTQWAAVTKE